jgi:hypothetical protein
MMISYRNLWLIALAIFVLAGSTGAFMRFGVIYGMAGFDYVNVRHAHSHLMYFGWVTPGLMALIAAHLPRLTGKPVSPRFGRVILSTAILGLVAYVPFLLYGYRSAELGQARLPLSVMAAFLNVLAWYAFAGVYRREIKGVPLTRTLWLWNAAVVFLLLATLGALGLPLMMLSGVDNPLWSLALTHIFLDLFSEGWIVLTGFGLAYAVFPSAARHPWARISGDLLVAGLPVVFLLYIPMHLIPPAVRWIGSIGGLLVVAGTLGNLAALWPAVSPGWRVPLSFLALKSLAQIGLLLPAVGQWAEVARMRIPYMHWMLLGFATLVLICAAENFWGMRGRRWMSVAVIVLSATLMPLTGLWPPGWGGLWALHVAAWAALGPVVVAIGMLADGLRNPQEAEVVPVKG